MKAKYNELKAAMDTSYEEGLEEGIEKGKKEEKIAIVMNALAAGTDIDLISKITGLSKEEIEKLKRNELKRS